MKHIRFHFDFVSPYAYLAWARAPALLARHDAVLEPRPVVYAALLDAHGLVGPVETDAKRRYTWLDVLRTARSRGLRLTGPPAHPFRSIEALRTVCAHREDPRVAALVSELFDSIWARGEDPTDLGVLAAAVKGAGVRGAGEAASLELDLARDDTKSTLRRNTEEALAAGVFGVPTFELDGELFWGDDRLEGLVARLEHEAPPEAELRAVLERPSGAARRPR